MAHAEGRSTTVRLRPFLGAHRLVLIQIAHLILLKRVMMRTRHVLSNVNLEISGSVIVLQLTFFKVMLAWWKARVGSDDAARKRSVTTIATRENSWSGIIIGHDVVT